LLQDWAFFYREGREEGEGFGGRREGDLSADCADSRNFFGLWETRGSGLLSYFMKTTYKSKLLTVLFRRMTVVMLA